MAVATEILATIGDARFGIRYDDVTLDISHIGAQNNSARRMHVQLEHRATGRTREGFINAGQTVFRDVSDFAFQVEVGLDDDGNVLVQPPFIVRARTA